MSEIPEHASEPVPGLPDYLPPGERILWQGRPDLWSLAVRALHIRKVALWLGAMWLVRVATIGGVTTHGRFIVLTLIALGLLLLLAWLMTRSTLYTLTSARVVMRFGIAVPISLNLPFATIESALLRQSSRQSSRQKGRGTADIAFAVAPDPVSRLSYAVLWPHARPWRVTPPQPMLRCLRDAEEVAGLLAEALEAHLGTQSVRNAVSGPAGRPKTTRPVAASPAFPRAPLFGAGALIAFAILSVTGFRLLGEAAAPMPLEDAVAAAVVRFEDRPDGAVLVFDADTGAELQVLAPGSNNFLRATLRGLVRGRAGESPRAPFGIYRFANGQLLLVDEVTGDRIDLWAFGETNAAAFGRLLDSGIAATSAGTTEQTLARRAQ